MTDLYYSGPLRLATDDGGYVVSDVRPSEYVRVRSRTFGGEFGGYASALVRVGPRPADVALSVRLELPDDAPAVRDAVADGLDADAAEFYDVVPLSAVERPDGRPVRVGVRGPSDAERAERARRRGTGRVALPDLDAGLRNAVARR